jgi:hypothetical protein
MGGKESWQTRRKEGQLVAHDCGTETGLAWAATTSRAAQRASLCPACRSTWLPSAAAILFSHLVFSCAPRVDARVRAARSDKWCRVSRRVRVSVRQRGIGQSLTFLIARPGPGSVPPSCCAAPTQRCATAKHIPRSPVMPPGDCRVQGNRMCLSGDSRFARAEYPERIPTGPR